MRFTRFHRAACLSLVGLALLLGSSSWAGPQSGEMPLAKMVFGRHQVLAEVPISSDQRMKGLGGRQTLEPGRGMLFIFYGKPLSMCMRGMHFPLDFIWLNQGKVSQISSNVPPGGVKVTVRAIGPAQMVLEVPAGWARDHGVHLGQEVNVTMLSKGLPKGLAVVLRSTQP
ncbi:MAG: DUF192 domain-containing protein [Deltaproteobacteria bacterium]|nr:DUF192 domain-containing protein [Deltaproteobacteria bacterium]